MINSIRSVRRAKGLSLAQVAERCDPPTTAQTVGRLETGTRTLSLDWLNRIAAALGVEGRDLVQMPDETVLSVAAVVGGDGAHAPAKPESIPMMRVEPGMVAVRFSAGLGDYRSGDVVWCRRMGRDEIRGAVNRDILVPRPAGRFLFGRLLALDGEKMQLLPLMERGRQQVIAMPEWAAAASRLVRNLDR